MDIVLVVLHFHNYDDVIFMFTKQLVVIQCHFALAGNEIFNDNIGDKLDKINVENLAVAESDTGLGAAIVRAGWLVSAEHVAVQGFSCSGPATAVLSLSIKMFIAVRLSDN